MHSMLTMRMAVLASFGLAAASLLAGQSAKTKGNFDVRAFGAKGDGATMDTAAVQATLDACARAGGGRVTVPPGTYLIGSIYLGDRTELHLESGATLLGSPNLTDYNAPDAYPQNWGSQKEGWSAKHLILALEKKGVSITGLGVIDGNGRAFFDDKPQFVGKVCWRDGGINARDYKHQGRPGQEIVFIECSDVEVRDVTFRDMSCWSCFFHGCENVTVGGVTVRNGMRNLNTDGFDVDSCRNVRIGDCDIVTGDDAIAIRGSPARLKDQSKVCENVRVSNIVCRVSADGVRVGVGDGTIRDVRISDMKIEHAGCGLHVQCCYGKTPKKGVDISNILFERISIREVAEAVSVVAGSELSKATLGGVRFVGIDAETCMPMTIAGGGTTHVDGVEFENCTFRFVKSPYDAHSDHKLGPQSGRKNGAFYIEKASGVAFRGSRLCWQEGAMPSVTRALAVHDAAAPSVDGLSSMPDRATAPEPSGAGEFSIDTPRATGGPVVRAVDFGFSPTSDKNAAAIMRALAECSRVKASRLELAPGTYRCFDEPGVVVRDFTDFTFDGKGAVLVFRRPPEYRCQPQSELILDKGNLLVQRCLRTEVRDLVMDWDWEGDPLASFVRVTRRNLDETHPENAWMELTFVDYERHPKYPEPVPVQKMMAMDECRTRFRAGPGLSCGQTEGHFGAKNEWTAPNVLRVWPGMPMPERNQNPATRFAANPKWNLQVVRRFEESGLYRLQHCYYGKNGINLDSNRHLTVRDVRVWACFGMAMVTDGAQEYWQVERLRVAPPTASEFAAAYPGKRFFERPVSSTSDGHHVARSKGHCKYVDCYWTRNNDDSNNFHDRFTIAVKVAPRTLYVINRRGAAYFRAVPGAPLELRNPDFSPAGCTAKLVRVKKELLELDRDIPDQKGPCFLVWDRTYGTDWVLFKGCTCEDSGWRNLFSPSNLTIEDCTFRRTPGVPLRLIADWRADLWCEGMGTTNVVIRNCTFEDAGLLTPKEGQISTRCVVPEGWDIPPPDKGFVGGDVLIEKCTFVRPTGPVLDLPTGRNVTMRDCTVDLRDNARATPSAGAFDTVGAENVRIERITTLR